MKENEKITQIFITFVACKLSEIYLSSVSVVTCCYWPARKCGCGPIRKRDFRKPFVTYIDGGAHGVLGNPCTKWCVVRQLLRSVLESEFRKGISKLHNHLGFTILTRFYGPAKENDLGNRESFAKASSARTRRESDRSTDEEAKNAGRLQHVL